MILGVSLFTTQLILWQYTTYILLYVNKAHSDSESYILSTYRRYLQFKCKAQLRCKI